MARALAERWSHVGDDERAAFLASVRERHAALQALGVYYWVFEDREHPGRVIEYLEARDNALLSLARTVVPAAAGATEYLLDQLEFQVMPTRTIDVAGREWRVFPSGLVTQYEHDEFALLFIAGTGDDREVRVTRYSPVGARSREQSLAELPDAELQRLFAQSQSSDTSPEAGYTR